jgi:hypothetical protein
MTAALLTFALAFAALAVVIALDDLWLRRNDHEEPPSRLDLLDWARNGITDPPADRHPDPLPPGVGSAGRSAGATTDDPWMP